MDITVGDFRIASDTTQFVMSHITKSGAKSKTPGEPVENFVGYFSTLDAAMRCLPSKMLMRSSATSLSEVVDELRRYRALIDDAMKGA